MRPQFSVVIPTFRRPGALANCLGGLAVQQGQADACEVIVVDDAGDGETEQVVQSFASRLNVRAIAPSHGGPARARNAGAALAEGRYLAFTDDDCVPDTAWLQQMAAAIRGREPAAVGGRTVNGLLHCSLASATQLVVDYACYRGLTSPGHFFPANNLVVPREPFLAMGGFDESFAMYGEDREFCDRWQRLGFRLDYAPEAIVRHLHPLDFPAFWQLHVNYGRGSYLFHALRARQLGGGIRFAPPRWYAGLIAHPLGQPDGAPHNARMALLVAIAQLANVTGFFWERQRMR